MLSKPILGSHTSSWLWLRLGVPHCHMPKKLAFSLAKWSLYLKLNHTKVDLVKQPWLHFPYTCECYIKSLLLLMDWKFFECTMYIVFITSIALLWPLLIHSVCFRCTYESPPLKGASGIHAKRNWKEGRLSLRPSMSCVEAGVSGWPCQKNFATWTPLHFTLFAQVGLLPPHCELIVCKTSTLWW